MWRFCGSAHRLVLRRSTVLAVRANASRATLLEYNLNLKADAKKQRMGLPHEKPADLPDYVPEAERILPESEVEEGEVQKEDGDTFSALNMPADQAETVEEDDLVAALEAEDSPEEDPEDFLERNQVSDEELEQAAALSLEQLKASEAEFFAKVEKEGAAEFEEENSPEYQLMKIGQSYENELQNIAQSEFRDTDKVILKIMREYKREPLRLWKSLKQEQLEPYIKNFHLYHIFKIFASFTESIPLLPDLLQWAKKSTTIQINPRVFDFAIREMARQGEGSMAVNEIVGMRLQGLKPQPTSLKAVIEHYSRVLTTLCKQQDLERVRKLFGWLRTNQIYVNTEAYHTIIESYIDADLLYQARDVLHKMSQDGELPDKKYYAKIIGIYCDKNDFEEAKYVLDEMDASGVYAPRSLTELVVNGLSSTNEVLAKEAQEDAKFRVNLKSFNQGLVEAYQP